MSDKLNEEKWPKTIKTLIIWSSTILLFISVFFPVEYFKSNALKEIAWGHKMIGEKDFVMVLQKARDNYTEAFVNTGIDKALKDFYQLPPSDMANHGGPLKYFVGLFQNIAENLNYWLYMIMYRLTLDMYWLPYMAVVIIPSLFAGVMRWMAKRYNFGYVKKCFKSCFNECNDRF